MLAVDYPLTHVLWVLASLFLCFFVIRVVTNYPAAAAFCFVIATAIPTWDVTGPIEVRLYAILWTTMAVAIGVLITIAVEFIFQSFVPGDQVLQGIDNRLQQVEEMLRALGRRQVVPEQVKSKLEQFALVGGSRLRSQLARAPYDPEYTAQVTAALALAVRLVESPPTSSGSPSLLATTTAHACARPRKSSPRCAAACAQVKLLRSPRSPATPAHPQACRCCPRSNARSTTSP